MTHVLRRNRDFRRFWLGHTISVFGGDVTYVALPLIATLVLGAGAAGVSAVATAGVLPSILLSLFAGNWLETRRRRGVMITADIARAALLGALPVAWALDALTLPLMVVLAFLTGVATVVFDLASFAYVPTMVDAEDLPAANQASQGSTTAAQVAGPGVAGLLITLLGPVLALVVDAASYLASALGIAGARRAEPLPPRPDRRPGVFSGLRLVLANPFMRAMTVHAAVYNAGAQILMINMVVMAVRERGLAPGWYGLALSAAGVGALLGTLIALRLIRRFGFGRSFMIALALETGAPLLLAAIPWDGLAFGGALAGLDFIAGVGLGVANVLSVTLRQNVLPQGTIARSNGSYRMITYGVLPIGAALAGILGETIGTRASVAVGTAAMAISALPMVARRVRRLRDVREARPEPVPVG
ncbi:MFS transporter [Actinorhabdospora filicis]|uniref:MFS transporter n=1 Tax=Actinorhabdospora filicis TaxID=1785913 RepID=A0A9W6SGL3_9ACTN|nr:MFS transporter [Actinorhabdospora filicis]GLZ76769.1 MFS transporter [Actinorhabdospora filicis]